MSLVVAFDTETFRFRPGVMAPEMVCLSYETLDSPTGVRSGPQLLHVKGGALDLLETWLADANVLLTGHYVQYDLAVIMAKWPHLIRPVFDAVAADRITCTKWRQVLLDIACGCYRWKTLDDGTRYPRGYDLGACIREANLGYNLSKGEDTWRLRYGELLSAPIPTWPAEARDYALLDAKACLDVYLAQEKFNADAIQGSGFDLLKSQYHEMRGYLGLQLASVWGLRTDPAKVDLLEIQIHEEIEKVHAQLVTAGFVREDGSRDTKKTACHMVDFCSANDLLLLKTQPTRDKKTGGMKGGGNVSLDADACEKTGDPLLVAYARYGTS